MSFLLEFTYPVPSSLLLNTMSVFIAGILANGGISELMGKSLPYSKFWDAAGGQKSDREPKKFSGKTGMLIAYVPAFMVSILSLIIFPDTTVRILLIKSILAVHFFKRILEVLFVHKYSGPMPLDAAILISSSYFNATTCMIYAQHLTLGSPDPAIDLKLCGFLLFPIGISGNFYHHLLLSRMRKDGEKGYKLPVGCLFDLITCPHYLFEIIVFWGVFCISQTLLSLIFALGTTFLLIGRSCATRRWYITKFDDFPNNVKAIIPFIL
ncbi:3-oxo-5-alpha-steroid 4-dehydrogenase 1-like [Impatiens glandulifera]|uniref:3-oxo-5-alpha-steroid 4-dehydrogenase 1-like n=1 Tax=Impatiens glandulifera TaxID=253017 RepID=UPI001FB12FF3|nr:3-oxo-5-alpha-steroid 4-dehydrogenase 1-like [Impatiens glandulifera]